MLGAILLAAGASTRMGTVKQLLPWKGSTLLEHTIAQLNSSGVDHLVVVLGENEHKISEKVSFEGIDVAVNTEWEKGMATSIASGLRFLLKKEPNLQSVLVALSDQPLLDLKYYNKLINIKLKYNYKIAASSYSGQFGVPAVFGRTHFDNLLNLKGQKGARALLRGGEAEVVSVTAGNLAVDLDTREKYDRIYEQHGRL